MASPFVGTWTYRSFTNDPNPDTPFQDLEFGRAELVLAEPETGIVAGTIGGSGWSLTLKGWLTQGNPNTVRFQGSGQIGSETWVYDYLGFLPPHWPNGVNQDRRSSALLCGQSRIRMAKPGLDSWDRGLPCDAIDMGQRRMHR